MRYPLDKLGRNLSHRTASPLHLTEFVRHERVDITSLIDHDRHDECALGGDEMRSIHRELPLKAEIALCTSAGVCRNDGHEQGAGLDLLPDRSIPCIAAAQFALVQPDFDAGFPERVADSASGNGVL